MSHSYTTFNGGWTERMRLTANGDLIIKDCSTVEFNTVAERFLKEQEQLRTLQDIVLMSETNPAVAAAYQKLLTVYHLSKKDA